MIAPSQVAVVMVAAFVGPAFAQQRGEPGIAALIEQLGDEETRKAATGKLVARGEPAATALLGLVTGGWQENSQRALQVLGYMRDHAELIVPELLPLRHLPAEGWPALLRAVADLAPYTRMDAWQVLSGFGADVQGVVAFSEPELGVEIYNETTRLSGRITVTSIRAHSEIPELVFVLETGDSDSRALAAELLGYRGRSAMSALPVLRSALLKRHPASRRMTIGVAAPRPIPFRSNRVNREIHRAAARAMEAIAGEDTAIALAVAHRLLHDPDIDQRMDAAMALGRFGEAAAETRALLVEALGDQELRVVREVITALGMLGGAGRDGLPALQELTAHDDRQIAERAKAAIRLIGRGNPGDRAAEPPVVPWNYEPPATAVGDASAMKARADVAALKNAVDLYLLQTRSRNLPTWVLLITPDERGNAWLEGYQQPPKDPWGNEYEIRPGDRGPRSYEIRSWGPDGISGTKDDISSTTIRGR